MSIQKKPLIARLAQVYEDTRLLYFVTDGEGNCMLDNVTQTDAYIFAMKNGWSIGKHDEKFTSEQNSEGVPITYENKDILNEEDLQ
jgi:hypothetical protein